MLIARHATCAAVGRMLAGRAAGMSLNADGRREAAALASELAHSGASAIYASPLERARETAEAIGAALHVPVASCDAFVELDVGEWTGCAVADLDAVDDDAWRRYNAYRSASRPPGGELQLEVQARAVGALLELAHAHASEIVIVVTHAEVIRAVLGHWLGVPIDLQHRIDIAPASVTTLELEPWGARVSGVGVVPGALRTPASRSSA